MPASTPDLLLAFVLTAGAAAVQGTIGFGVAILSVPLLAMIDPVLAPVPQLLVSLPLAVLQATRDRSSIELRPLKWVLIGRIPGAAIGIALLLTFNRTALSIAIAVMVIGAALVLATNISVPRTDAISFAAGTLSGITGLVGAIGGPPLALLYRNETGPVIRASLGVVFGIGLTISIVVRAAVGEISGDDVKVATVLLPAVLIGLWISRFTVGRVEGTLLRRAILLVAGIAGVGLLVQTLIS